MPILTREQILAAQDIKTERVAVPEWGGEVLVRGMTGAERDRYEQSVLVQAGKSTRVNMVNARARLVALTVVDEQGKRYFSEEDITALGKKNAAALEHVFNVAARLAGITEEDMKELTEELQQSPFDVSPSD